ncbi:hypothetical protein RBG61_12940 [Paludicola sp. MB14-C6]|uniref:hypothetical protein n=1 Tax=Paludihabitans sp. MB14-C6 TaxID=3070656 RepID=UPI0027DB6FF6|nr:hypothetical protein [Paludicola sp. MB14-C6]WMJ22882.1 hypothetical protein RBG61_12940 [Paludicola sp. MB14-C6]
MTDLYIDYVEPSKKAMLYSDSSKDLERGCIGHYRGDFGSGNEFYQNWFDHQQVLNTMEFKEEFKTIIEYLRDNEVLKNRVSMAGYCNDNKNAMIDESTYGFCVKTDDYKYYIRCNPGMGDYNFYIYCYQNDPQIPEKINQIRFIDSHYKDLFTIPDGGKITITLSNGERMSKICRYLDEYHTDIGGRSYHICEFAECMEKNGNDYKPYKSQKQLER